MPSLASATRTRWKIAELERLSGVGRSTLHLYRNLGLLPPPEKRGPKLHYYGPAHLERLRELGRLKQRGLSLAQMRERLEAREKDRVRRERKRPDRRQPGPARALLLDSAARLFTERGYEPVAMSEVARGAGVGKATLYQHFRSKSELFLACLDRLTQSVAEAQARFIAERGASFRSDVEQYAASIIVGFPAHRMMIIALSEAAFGKDPELAEHARRAFLRMANAFAPLLERAMRTGRCRTMDVEMLSYMAWGALMAVGARLEVGDARYGLHEALHTYLDFVTYGVVPRR